MSETEPASVTPDTGSGTSEGETDGETIDTASDHVEQRESKRETEEREEREQSYFGGLGPVEAGRRRWAQRDTADLSTPRDPRVKLAAGLLKRAETGDVKAYEAWQRITTELEQERLSRDGADGAEAWERLQPEQRRWLLALLEGKE